MTTELDLALYAALLEADPEPEAEPGSDGEYTCNECGATFGSYDALVSHLATAH